MSSDLYQQSSAGQRCPAGAASCRRGIAGGSGGWGRQPGGLACRVWQAGKSGRDHSGRSPTTTTGCGQARRPRRSTGCCPRAVRSRLTWPQAPACCPGCWRPDSAGHRGRAGSQDGRRAARPLPRRPRRPGHGEAIPLGDAAADGVFISSAWHWMDPDRAIREIARVLRDCGRFGVVWTSRDHDVDWLRELDQSRMISQRRGADAAGPGRAGPGPAAVLAPGRHAARRGRPVRRHRDRVVHVRPADDGQRLRRHARHLQRCHHREPGRPGGGAGQRPGDAKQRFPGPARSRSRCAPGAGAPTAFPAS